TRAEEERKDKDVEHAHPREPGFPDAHAQGSHDREDPFANRHLGGLASQTLPIRRRRRAPNTLCSPRCRRRSPTFLRIFQSYRRSRGFTEFFFVVPRPSLPLATFGGCRARSFDGFQSAPRCRVLFWRRIHGCVPCSDAFWFDDAPGSSLATSFDCTLFVFVGWSSRPSFLASTRWNR